MVITLRTRLNIQVSQAAMSRILYLAPFPLFYRRVVRNGTAQSKSHQSYFERCKKRTLHSSEIYILLFPKSTSLLIYHLTKLPRLPTHAHPTMSLLAITHLLTLTAAFLTLSAGVTAGIDLACTLFLLFKI